MATRVTPHQLSNLVKGGHKKLATMSNAELRKLARYHSIPTMVDGKYRNKESLITAINEVMQVFK